MQNIKSNQNKKMFSNSCTNSVVQKNRIFNFEQICSIFPFSMFHTKPVVAVLRLEGLIGKTGGIYKQGLTAASINTLIEKAFQLDKLEAVCLSINSPGGSPVQSELITDRIISLSKEKNVPVYSFVEDVAASGGYWLALAGEKIFVSKSSIVGSIGVISRGFGFQHAIEKLGIERRVYSQGKNKSVLDPFTKAKDSDISIVKKLQKEIHRHFIDIVKTRRGGKLTQSDEILFNGEFWSGQIAADYGLVDGIDNLHSFIYEKYGNNVHIEYIENKQSWLKKKLGVASFLENNSDLTGSVLDSMEERLLYNKFDIK